MISWGFSGLMEPAFTMRHAPRRTAIIVVIILDVIIMEDLPGAPTNVKDAVYNEKGLLKIYPSGLFYWMLTESTVAATKFMRNFR
jgi:hypothetical protein